MPTITVVYGEQQRTVNVPSGTLLGEAIALTGLPLEQPCAGRGTCGKCKVLVETGISPPEAVERQHLTAGELALDNRLACRAQVESDARVVLAPIVVYSNKIFRLSSRYKREQGPLGLAIDLGTTTVAAFLTVLEDGEVCAGSAALNQQSVYGADVISRLKAAQDSPDSARRLHNLALASINQAVDSLNLSAKIRRRILRVVVVGNVAMHHLLASLPVHTLTAKPFQPLQRQSLQEASHIMGGIFPGGASVSLPPLIGGFVGSDALACLAYFHFDRPQGPMIAVDLGTNGEVLVTDGDRILVASTAAGPAFEGVFISCGTRAVDGAITAARLQNGEFIFETIAGEPPIGLTGSGLISLVHVLRREGVIEPSGRIADPPPILQKRISKDEHGRRISLLNGHPPAIKPIYLTQWDIRELQKAKGAIRAAIDILMARLNLASDDISRLVLTGSFGGQIDISAAQELGLVPPVPRARIQSIANGAGLGAAMFLNEVGFALGEELAARAEQVDLDRDPTFIRRYVGSMVLAPEPMNEFMV
jgi:uncharacterized 2Fe-2S/4Fe-4S cluster protein (DUF4445 family)